MDRKAVVSKINEYIQQNGVSVEVLRDLLDLAREPLDECEEVKYWLQVTAYIKAVARQQMEIGDAEEYARIFEETYRIEAFHSFESYLWYMEKDRPLKRKFYEPRKATLKTVVDDLQDLEDGVIRFYGLSMPPRVGKSTICIFFMSWVMGRHPNNHSAMGGHSGLLAKGFYSELLTLITSQEYHFSEIFPKSKLEHKSSEDFTINLDKKDRFATMTCRGYEGTWTGAIDISRDGYLYVDDLVRDREESLSPVRLDNLYQTYLNVMVDRMNDGAKQLMVATRWNLTDPLGREEERLADRDDVRFRKIPALNDEDVSNFEYTQDVGFSTDYYREMRGRLDQNEWEAKYQQRPYVREGLLFPADELNYFNGVLPEEEHYIACACDVAFGGSDSLSMPICAVYPEEVYIIDWVFNNGDKFVTRPLVVDKILKYQPQRVQFEANNGGSEYADLIDEELRRQGFKTNITTPRASNKISKEGKIIQYAPDIKRTFYFLEPNKQYDEYRKAMEEVTMYTQLGKNKHDDSVDSLVQLFQLVDGNRVAKIEPMFFRI